jgi:lipid-A-disaccharide synthase
MPPRVFITVGETSGDAVAADLVRALKQLNPQIIIEGLGGPAMKSAGATIHHDTVAHAAMGLRAFLRAAEVKKLLAWTRDYYRKTPPDLHVCVDSWTMNCNFAKLAKELGKPVLYYVAPQAWASRPGRVKRMKKYIDRLACILPFEEEWFSSRGVPTQFVGHPLFDRLPPTASRPKEFSPDAPVIALIPGSRRSIAKNNFPPMLDVAQQIIHAFHNVRFLIPTTDNTDAIIRAELTRRDLSNHFQVERNAFDELVPQCDLALTISGTSTLHVAAHNVPMLVVYRGSRLLWNLLGRWLITARTFAMVNILSGHDQHIVPEFIPWYGSPDPVAHAALEFLRHPAMLQQQRKALAEMIRPLSTAGASKKVAEMAMELMH